ncbi:MAG: DUF4394 domain-containing protein [Tahibacter sp.]
MNAFPIYGLTDLGVLLKFDSATPGTLDATIPIFGLGAGERIIGMDFRPADSLLYCVTVTAAGVGRLYKLDKVSGVASGAMTLTADLADSTAPYSSLSGNHYGVNFNPVVDRLRIVSDNGANLRVNPALGTVFTDTNLNPGSPVIVGVSYSNPFAGATATSLYDIEPLSDSLLTQEPANSGALSNIGSFGLDIGDLVGFEVTMQSGANLGYASFTNFGTTSLYTVGLGNGLATLVGAIDTSPALIGLSISSDEIFRTGFE